MKKRTCFSLIAVLVFCFSIIGGSYSLAKTPKPKLNNKKITSNHRLKPNLTNSQAASIKQMRINHETIVQLQKQIIRKKQLIHSSALQRAKNGQALTAEQKMNIKELLAMINIKIPIDYKEKTSTPSGINVSSPGSINATGAAVAVNAASSAVMPSIGDDSDTITNSIDKGIDSIISNSEKDGKIDEHAKGAGLAQILERQKKQIVYLKYVDSILDKVLAVLGTGNIGEKVQQKSQNSVIVEIDTTRNGNKPEIKVPAEKTKR